MKRIFQYEVKNAGYFKLLMAAEAEILSVQFDRNRNKIYMYACVPVDSIEVEREFTVMDTGQRYDQYGADYKYIGSFQKGQMGHLFEIVQ